MDDPFIIFELVKRLTLLAVALEVYLKVGNFTFLILISSEKNQLINYRNSVIAKSIHNLLILKGCVDVYLSEIGFRICREIVEKRILNDRPLNRLRLMLRRLPTLAVGSSTTACSTGSS